MCALLLVVSSNALGFHNRPSMCFMDFTSTPELMDTGMDRSLPVEGEGDKGEEGKGKEGRERKGGGWREG